MKKKILYVSPISIFPKVMASQDRILNMALYLSKVHDVDFVMPLKNIEQKKEILEILKGISGSIVFIHLNFFAKILLYFLKKVSITFFNDFDEGYYLRRNFTYSKILSLIRKNNYDIIHLEYWYQGEILRNIKNKCYKVIDTHNVLFEKRFLEKKELGDEYNWTKKQLERYKKLEIESYSLSDILISISNPDLHFFKNYFPNKEHIRIYTGQNVTEFSSYKPTFTKENIVLFYGSMGGIQNIEAFWRLYKNIFPEIKKKISNTKLLVVGSNPPMEIKALDNGKDIEVTGFVDDLKKTLSKASLMILPMNIAGGFRSRVVEVMALGIPIIGTHNAFDNVGITNGLEGFISDSYDEMAAIAIELLSDVEKLQNVGEKAKEFCRNNFSLENTYGKLNVFYSNMEVKI